MKKQLWQLLNFVYFLHVELLARNTLKHQTGKKFKNLLRINLD